MESLPTAFAGMARQSWGKCRAEIGCEGTRGIPGAAFPLAAGADSGGGVPEMRAQKRRVFFLSARW